MNNFIEKIFFGDAAVTSRSGCGLAVGYQLALISAVRACRLIFQFSTFGGGWREEENVVRFFGELLTPLIRPTAAICVGAVLRLFGFEWKQVNIFGSRPIDGAYYHAVTVLLCVGAELTMTMTMAIYFGNFLFWLKYANLGRSHCR